MSPQAAQTLKHNASQAAPGYAVQPTLALANIALAKLRASRLPATPHIYEIWYAYASGQNPSLNLVLDELLARNGNVPAADIEQVGARLVAPVGTSERIHTAGSQMQETIGRVLTVMNTASGSTSVFSDQLDRICDALGRIRKSGELVAVIADMMRSMQTIKAANIKCEAELSALELEIKRLQTSTEIIRKESQSDPVTGLTNRKVFDQIFPNAITESAKRNEPLSFVMGDIDRFKMFNDTWGHLTGDQVLRLVASSLRDTFRREDIIARYGGDEFAIVLPSVALGSAVETAEQFRCAVMSKSILNRSTGQNMGRVMMSLGVATARPGDSAEALLERADACLYAAKRGGRNRVASEAH